MDINQGTYFHKVPNSGHHVICVRREFGFLISSYCILSPSAHLSSLLFLCFVLSVILFSIIMAFRVEASKEKNNPCFHTYYIRYQYLRMDS